MLPGEDPGVHGGAQPQHAPGHPHWDPRDPAHGERHRGPHSADRSAPGTGRRHPPLHHLLRGAGPGQAAPVRDVRAAGRAGRAAGVQPDGGAGGGGGAQPRGTWAHSAHWPPTWSSDDSL